MGWWLDWLRAICKELYSDQVPGMKPGILGWRGGFLGPADQTGTSP